MQQTWYAQAPFNCLPNRFQGKTMKSEIQIALISVFVCVGDSILAQQVPSEPGDKLEIAEAAESRGMEVENKAWVEQSSADKAPASDRAKSALRYLRAAHEIDETEIPSEMINGVERALETWKGDKLEELVGELEALKESTTRNRRTFVRYWNIEGVRSTNENQSSGSAPALDRSGTAGLALPSPPPSSADRGKSTNSSSRWQIGTVNMSVNFRVTEGKNGQPGIDVSTLTIHSVKPGEDVLAAIRKTIPGGSKFAVSQTNLIAIWAALLFCGDKPDCDSVDVTATETTPVNNVEIWTVKQCGESIRYRVEIIASGIRVSDVRYFQAASASGEFGETDSLPVGWMTQAGKDGRRVAYPPGWLTQEGSDGRLVAFPVGWRTVTGEDGRLVAAPLEWRTQAGKDGRLVAFPWEWRGEEGKDGRLVASPWEWRTQAGKDGRLVAFPWEWRAEEGTDGRLVAFPWGWLIQAGKDGRIVPYPAGAFTEENAEGRIIVKRDSMQPAEDLELLLLSELQKTLPDSQFRMCRTNKLVTLINSD